MPYRPPSPCAHPGCPKLTHTRFCDEHAKAEARRYEKYQRDPNTKKRYGTTWRHVRAAYIAAHPLCERCQAEGRYEKAIDVHHILPLTQGGSHDQANLQALCKACHAKTHAERGERFTRRPR